MINFIPLQEEHIPTVVDWVYSNHVYPFWVSAHGVEKTIISKKYYSRLNDENIKTYIIVINGVHAGLIQTSVMEDTTLFKRIGKSMGIDLYIGDFSFVGKGYGTSLLRLFIKEYIFSNPDILFVCIDPEVANEVAIHVYQKVGFKIVNIGYDKFYKMLTCYMILSRQDFFAK